jgi:hypothetical protein
MFVREFKPKWKYHATLAPKLVRSRQEECKLGSGWSDQYQHQEYPKALYHPNRRPPRVAQDGTLVPPEPLTKVVQNEEEKKVWLASGWYQTPADFPPERPAGQPAAREQARKKQGALGKRHDNGPSRPVITVTNTESVHSTPSGETTNAVQQLDLTERHDHGSLQEEVKVLKPKAAELERVDRPNHDPWEKQMEGWAIDRDTISVTEVLASCIGKPKTQWTQADKNRVARSLRALGWKRFQHRHGPSREWRYRRTK